MPNYNHSGYKDATYKDIPENSNFTISGTGNVIINGKIGKKSTIIKSGTGYLKILGEIEESTMLNINGTGNIIINKKIGKNSTITKSGSGDLKILEALEENTKLDINGTGDAEIYGKIGKNSSLIKSGCCDLKIYGEVEENVIFKISGTGNTLFKKTSPQSVMKKLSKSGCGDISFLDGKYSSSNLKKESALDTSEAKNYSIMIKQSDSEDALDTSDTQKESIVIIQEDSNSGEELDTSDTPSDSMISNTPYIDYPNLTTSGKISMKSSGGIITITRDGVTTQYIGNSSCLKNNDLYIDGIKVTPSDSRIIKSGASSSATSTFSFSSLFSFPSSTSSVSVSQTTPAKKDDQSSSVAKVPGGPSH